MLKRIHYNSPVILTMTLLSFAVMLLGYLTKGYTNSLLFSVYRGSLTDVFFYFRLFGHVLGHVGWEHYINNFLLILVLGPMLEEKYGSKKILIMIVVTAFVTGILNILFSSSHLLGASGIVFMLILLSSFVNVQKGRIPVTFILVVIIYIGRELMTAWGDLMQDENARDNISQLAHLAGGVCGGVFGFAFLKQKK
ncbi:MAG: rhomboid family intramembrane serine protease [Clostridiaceae bacterium]|nr:rhomboid family intramembrane serine protease [Clostridiaceae bacterium]